MITTEYPAHLLDPDRLCTCLHSWAGHEENTRGMRDLDNPTASTNAGPCSKCRCGQFNDRVAWRIELEVPAFPDEEPQWVVVAPSGRRMWSVPTAEGAYQLAHSMAAIDEMLARIRRLEGQTFGAHPSLRQPARRAGRPRVRGLEVVK